jgi:roadblock/LC7 domain-containing protein
MSTPGVIAAGDYAYRGDRFSHGGDLSEDHARIAFNKLLVLDGVVAACRFQDDGTIIDHAGILPDETMVHLARFAHWYRRMVSGNTDLLSLFSQMRGWAPSQGWIVMGQSMTVCGMGNTVLLQQNDEGSLNEVALALQDAAHW